MKKLTAGLFVMAAFCLTSCDMSSEQTAKNTIQVGNLVTNLSTGEVIASQGDYTFDLNFTNQEGTVDFSKLDVGSQKYTFNSQSAVMNNGFVYNTGLVVASFSKLTGNFNGDISLPIKDVKFAFTPGYMGQQCVVADYKIGDEFRVRTFPISTIYVGTTTTTYPNMGGQGDAGTGSYKNETMTYIVRLDLEKKKAVVVMNNAKFSDSNREPEKNVYVDGLDVEFFDGYYRITGENITPKLVEGNLLTDYPAFNIKTFTMSTSDSEMMKVNMSYTVLHTMTMGSGDSAQEVTVTYTGQFSGNYTALPGQNPQM